MLFKASTQNFRQQFIKLFLTLGGLSVLAVLIWQGVTSNGVPDPTIPHMSYGAAILNTAALVFREGLETILVLAAVMAGFTGTRSHLKLPVAQGALSAVLMTVFTWFIAVGIIADISKDVSALNLQAATGLIAVIYLTVVMNWFLHKFYWTGWISAHGRAKRDLLAEDSLQKGATTRRVLLGMAFLGFSSVYREGFEIVLLLQSLRLQVGSAIVLQGVGLGLFFTSIVGVLTFYAHQRLPYRNMLIVTGVMLGVVLLVMVGEQAQEMQQAGWIANTPLGLPIPGWMGIWLSVFDSAQTLAAQALAALIVLGSYVVGQHFMVWRKRRLA